LWSAASARNVETAPTPTVNVLRGLVARATTPLLPDDYLKLLNPLWSARELRGLVVDLRKGISDAAIGIVTVPLPELLAALSR
jgi:stearoyl-CoA 9-desaturase NADPH oxidoreductase